MTHQHLISARPAPGTYPAFFDNYFSRVLEGSSPLNMLATQPTAMHQLIGTLTEEQAALRYAAGKWSIKQMVLHVTDTERIFSYRALRFARADAQSLPGFDENQYADYSDADARTLSNLLDEYAAVRLATLALFSSFGPAQLARQGAASGHPVTVSALLFALAGHEEHHLHILKERYLPLL